MFSSKFEMACVILCSIIDIIKEKRKETEFYRMSFCITDLALKPSLSFSSAFTDACAQYSVCLQGLFNFIFLQSFFVEIYCSLWDRVER